MKVWEHAAIGLASGALLYFTSLTIPFETALILAGILIGAALPEIDGNWPKNFQHNPLLFWASYVNHLVVYPFVMFTYRTRELHRRDLSTFLAIGIYAALFYGVYWIVGQFFPMPFPVEPVVLGILFGGACTIAGHMGTGGGTRPLFPISTWWLHGSIEPRDPGEIRAKALIVVPLALSAFFVIAGSDFPGFETPYLPVNQWALIIVWAGYLIAADTIPLREIPARLGRGMGSLIPGQYPFESEVERYNFEALNAARQDHGIRKLRFARRHAKLCRHHSKAMAGTGHIFHGDNVRRIHASSTGENVAEIPLGWVNGFDTPIEEDWDVGYALHDIWMNSPGHRSNMLNPAFRRVGIGVYWDGGRYYATQLFST